MVMNWKKFMTNLRHSMIEEPALAEYTKLFVMRCLSIKTEEDLKLLKQLREIKFQPELDQISEFQYEIEQ